MSRHHLEWSGATDILADLEAEAERLSSPGSPFIWEEAELAERAAWRENRTEEALAERSGG
jgi:hypothetical protein